MRPGRSGPDVIARVPHVLGAALSTFAAIAAWRLQFSAYEWFAWSISGAAVGWLGHRLWPHPGAGIAVAGVFLSMPLVLLAAPAVSVITMLALTAWLAAVDAYERTGRTWWLAAAIMVVAAGAMSGGRAFMTMPVLAAATMLAFVLIDQPSAPPWPAQKAAIGAGTIAFAAIALYVALNGDWAATRAAAYHLYDTGRFNVLQGAREMTSWVGLTVRSETYWHYFDPSFLFWRTFQDGPGSRAQVFPIAAIALLPLGILRATRPPMSRVPALIVAGLLAAPLAGALIAQPPTAAWFVIAAPFAALLMFGGLAWLLFDARPARVRAGLLLAAVLVAAAAMFAYAVGAPPSAAA